jgi:hypothetical protein
LFGIAWWEQEKSALGKATSLFLARFIRWDQFTSRAVETVGYSPLLIFNRNRDERAALDHFGHTTLRGSPRFAGFAHNPLSTSAFQWKRLRRRLFKTHQSVSRLWARVYWTYPI